MLGGPDDVAPAMQPKHGRGGRGQVLRAIQAYPQGFAMRAGEVDIFDVDVPGRGGGPHGGIKAIHPAQEGMVAAGEGQARQLTGEGLQFGVDG